MKHVTETEMNEIFVPLLELVEQSLLRIEGLEKGLNELRQRMARKENLGTRFEIDVVEKARTGQHYDEGRDIEQACSPERAYAMPPVTRPGNPIPAEIHAMIRQAQASRND